MSPRDGHGRPAGLHLISSGNPPALPKWLGWVLAWEFGRRDQLWEAQPGVADGEESSQSANMVMVDRNRFLRASFSQRGQCSRSSVGRVARRADLKGYIFGSGRNGKIRYWRREVIEYEAKRQA